MKRTRSEVVVIADDDDDVNDRRKVVVPKKPKTEWDLNNKKPKTEWEKEKSEKELKMIYELRKRLLAKKEQEIEARKVDLSMFFCLII